MNKDIDRAGMEIEYVMTKGQAVYYLEAQETFQFFHTF